MARAEKPDFLRAVEAIEGATGLHVCVNFAPGFLPVTGPSPVDWAHRGHRSAFCKTVQANKKIRSCGGYDARDMTAEAGRRRRPFVNLCRAGVAEVIVPLFDRGAHVATVFCGQAVTEEVERGGFREIRRRVEPLDVDLAALEKAYNGLTRMSKRRLLDIGRIIALAMQPLVDKLRHLSLETAALLRQHPGIGRAVAFLREHCTEDLSLQAVARQCGVSPAHFCRLFKRITGTTMMHHVAQLRMSLAQQLLLDTSLKVIEVALQVGYSRHSYFTRKFREITGRTPTEFRRKVRGEGTLRKHARSKK